MQGEQQRDASSDVGGAFHFVSRNNMMPTVYSIHCDRCHTSVHFARELL